MKSEDFDQQFAQHDPAAELAPMSEADVAAVVQHATTADAPRLLKPVAPRTKWFVGVAAATAAVVALNAPATMVASVPVLHLAGGASSSKVTADSAIAGGYRSSDAMVWVMPFHFTASGVVSSVAPSDPQTAYKLVPVDNVDATAQRIIEYFGIKDVTETPDPNNSANKTWTSSSTSEQYLYIYNGPGASWSYANPRYDNFACTKVATDSKDPAICEPRTIVNILSKTEAEQKAISILTRLGLYSGTWKWQTEIDDRGATSTGTLMVNGFTSPILVGFTFADNGEIAFAWGSLQTVVALGDYNIISEFDAITRANEITDKWLKQVNQGSNSPNQTAGGVATGSSSASATPSAAASSSPSDVVTDPTYSESGSTGAPNMVAQEASVTQVHLTMTEVWDTKGNQLWLPAYELVGNTAESTDSWTLTTVVAIVDSQIDLSDFYIGGVMPMMR